MSRLLAFASLILALGLSACGQEETWRKPYTGTETIPNGDLFITSWASPQDSGFVAVALISPDSARFTGFKVVDQFPPQMWFEVALGLPCHAGSLGGFLSLSYRVDEQTVLYQNRTFDVSDSRLFVIPLDSTNAMLYHLPTDSSAVRLPPETRQELERRFPQAFS